MTKLYTTYKTGIDTYSIDIQTADFTQSLDNLSKDQYLQIIDLLLINNYVNTKFEIYANNKIIQGLRAIRSKTK